MPLTSLEEGLATNGSCSTGMPASRQEIQVAKKAYTPLQLYIVITRSHPKSCQKDRTVN